MAVASDCISHPHLSILFFFSIYMHAQSNFMSLHIDNSIIWLVSMKTWVPGGKFVHYVPLKLQHVMNLFSSYSILFYIAGFLSMLHWIPKCNTDFNINWGRKFIGKIIAKEFSVHHSG